MKILPEKNRRNSSPQDLLFLTPYPLNLKPLTLPLAPYPLNLNPFIYLKRERPEAPKRTSGPAVNQFYW
jgi:hypothetical protein